MQINNRTTYIFFVILLVAFVLRCTQLGTIPTGVNRDEASIGFTAYSILTTGRDEYGVELPLSIRSFGDWKLPAYVYISIPFILIGGLTDTVVRIPSMLFGTTTVALMYFLVLKQTKNTNLSLLSMGILALSPWHIHFSRMASEANTALFFFVSALLLLMYAEKKPVLFIPSSILFSLTYYTYHGNHITTTLLILALLYVYRRLLKPSWFIGVSILIFLLLTGLILNATLFEANKTKISGIGIFGNPTTIHERIELPRSAFGTPTPIIAKIIYNKFTVGFQIILSNYVNSFLYDFLAIRGGTNHAHNIPDMGNIYIFEYPFMLVGIYILFKRKSPFSTLMLSWLFISPIAASITKDAPHSARTFMMVLPLTTVMAVGMNEAYIYFRKKPLISILIGLFYVAALTQYLYLYYFEFPRKDAAFWGNKYRQVSEYVKKYPDAKVIIEEPQESPYIFLLFYSKYDPLQYQHEANRYEETSDGFSHVLSFSRFQFRSINWEKDNDTNTILVSTKKPISGNLLEPIPVTYNNSPPALYITHIK